MWGYPFKLSMHVIGHAIVVGISSMLDLRLLGTFTGIRTAAFLPLLKFAWIGFLINAVSGVFLFMSQATTFVQSKPFLTKISCVIAGAVLTKAIQGKLSESEPGAGGLMKGLAVVSLSLRLVAITAGRLIAYVGTGQQLLDDVR